MPSSSAADGGESRAESVRKTCLSQRGAGRDGRHLGFDTYEYPGDEVMAAWRHRDVPYEWVGYYLPAPCHKGRTWTGKRERLAAMGWGMAVIYVGQQTWDRRPTGYPAGENCVFARTDDGLGLVPRLDPLAAGGLVPLTASRLTDGPWCPDQGSARRFDADLFRIRTIAVTRRPFIPPFQPFLRAPLVRCSNIPIPWITK